MGDLATPQWLGEQEGLGRGSVQGEAVCGGCVSY